MTKIKIGKNVIENLTTGMYEDSKIIYREYIQNAADQIDKAKKSGLFVGEDLYIEIQIDDKKRNISIYDNATGIKTSDIVKKLADIADSDKNKTEDKGFRGIGRLGGLAYCDKLRFITSYKGEDKKTIMTWDAKRCRELIDDSSVKKSAEEILEEIISYETLKHDKNDHFFTVEMLNIRSENSELLDENKVCQYIAWNAPVPYNIDFLFTSKIKDYINSRGYKVDEYQILVNGDDIHKRYKDKLYESQTYKMYDQLYDVEFKELHNSKGELLAWIWFGVSGFKKNIPSSSNEMKGIRLRKENIQIGDEITLDKFFKETRGNGYYVGEVHAIHNDLVPNARRDYFNENNTRVEFDTELEYFFKNTLHYVYHDANKIKNSFKKIQTYGEKTKEFDTKPFINKDEKTKLQEELDKMAEDVKKAQKEIKRYKEKAESNNVLKRVMSVYEKEYANPIDYLRETAKEIDILETEKKDKKEIYITSELSKLNKGERKIVEKIYTVIKAMLDPKTSGELINKIQSELKK
ncbi:ATP-binding protein [Alkaliphilus pronyensis]|uniref:ATP-binding protein n=1 Tax=Alkaliphilus pronyensis TaxID=1482732 RepID=A0A6I0F7Z3_9FIRM|nr:ATP-binding protein [Alkaliphilus pronyensis]KAB3534495.1 ATP-binding protein [Alkaliphilus pronyensis]